MVRALVAAAQEESDNNERGEQGRAALADEGERDAGKGMSLVTPPTMMNAWSTMIEVRPAPISELTSDFARAAVTKPRIAKHRYKSSRPAAPRSPASSPMAAKMKSLSTTGMRVMPLPPPAMPRPIPVPNRSPSASE